MISIDFLRSVLIRVKINQRHSKAIYIPNTGNGFNEINFKMNSKYYILPHKEKCLISNADSQSTHHKICLSYNEADIFCYFIHFLYICILSEEKVSYMNYDMSRINIF